HGRSSYLRLSTRPIDQQLLDRAFARLGEEALRRHALAGGYRLVDWRDEAPDLSPDDVVQIVVAGAMAPEGVAAAHLLHCEGVAANVLMLTSASQLYREHQSLRRHAATHPAVVHEHGHLGTLIPPDERRAPMVAALDGTSHALAWLGGAFGVPMVSLGVDEFGQSGDRKSLIAEYGIDVDSIVAAALFALEGRSPG
ncbi:MAG: pyruvate dehydrogenase, partial [Chloroflexi bacterium]|nr:pyruvate dehydrogenase [Chloroflexota bacterium]